ncbi:MAG: RNA polymerase factor sigma-54 [Ignavibacteria bacterium]|nr:RNA polymerase factor sigma-54 [Ignavibacteria bacterium]
MLRNSQGQILQQKLSPQAIQAQLLLAIPTIALDQEIKKQLEDNPVLEDENVSDESAEEIPENVYPDDNWNPGSGSSSYSDIDQEERTEYLINRQNKQRETPLEQVYKLGLSNIQVLIAEEILGNLEANGYLSIALPEITRIINEKYGKEVSLEEAEHVLKIVQKLDPSGIAARDLKECLSIQLHEMKIDEKERELCLKMINEFFDDFKLKHFEKLAKLLDVPVEKVNELFEIIHRLNPSPGKQDTSADYIYPDFIIKESEGKLRVELNNDSNPQVRISRKYLELLKDKKTDKDTKEFLKNKVESAKWFLNAIQSRKDTMLKVMNAILARQKEFFLTHGENLKPMFEKDIAEDINMDISTVSRVVRGKYVQTDFGIYELKYFFSGGMKTDSGEDISNKILKEKIRDLIECENKLKPLSDDKLMEFLNKDGFNIARRTVAKYREAMKIPKATLRRKITAE